MRVPHTHFAKEMLRGGVQRDAFVRDDQSHPWRMNFGGIGASASVRCPCEFKEEQSLRVQRGKQM